MTKMIRCDCGFVARDTSVEELNKAAELHLKESHPETDLKLTEACWTVENEEQYIEESQLGCCCC